MKERERITLEIVKNVVKRFITSFLLSTYSYVDNDDDDGLDCELAKQTH